MIKVNDNFLSLSTNYLFSEIARRVNAYSANHPDKRIVRMGIGDVTRPLCKAAIDAMNAAVKDLSDSTTFRGYGPETGYDFLVKHIIDDDYAPLGVDLSPDEVFVSDGAKSDTGNIGDILSADCRIAVTDPVYPVYVDTNVMAGRAGHPTEDGRWSRIIYLPCTIANDFVPQLPSTVPDVIYLCYPNNPTGTVLTRDQLKVWVDYARRNGSLILFDAAYEAYIHNASVPHSIYEIEGAKECSIEFRSYSKTAGFTGVRCGYTIVPRQLYGTASDGRKVSLNDLWRRRQTTKFNGASYVSQRAAEAIYSPYGREEVASTIAYYKRNAHLLYEGLKRFNPQGAIDSPYVWIKTPDGMTSWDFFELMLKECQVVCTPGSGFGPSGEGYCRFTGFATREATVEAIERIKLFNI